LEVIIKDGQVSKAEPAEIVGYVAVPFGKWFENISYA